MNPYADLIIQAYRHGSLISRLPAQPLSFDEAIVAQHEVMQTLGKRAGAFKVGIREDLGCGIVAPMFSDRCTESGGMLTVSNLGLRGIETELAIRLKHDITPEMARDGIAGILPAIGEAVFALEICTTRYGEQTHPDKNASLADNLSNEGFVLGQDTWRGDLDVNGIDIVVKSDDTVIFDGRASHPLGHPLDPVVAYAKLGVDPLGALKAGAVITTGALSGMLAVRSPCLITATFAHDYSVSVRLTT